MFDVAETQRKSMLCNLVGPPTRQRRTIRAGQALSNSTCILCHKIDPRPRSLTVMGLQSIECPRMHTTHLTFTSNTSVPNAWLSFKRKSSRTLTDGKKKRQRDLDWQT